MNDSDYMLRKKANMFEKQHDNLYAKIYYEMRDERKENSQGRLHENKGKDGNRTSMILSDERNGKIKHPLFLLLLFCFLIIFSACSHDFTDSILVITESETDHTIHYYEMNHSGDKKETKEFEPDEMEIYYVENAYRDDVKDNKIHNELTLDRCTIKDATGQTIEMTDDLLEIITKVSELKHCIIKNKILLLDDTYYVVVEFNVNLWSPYAFYVYDSEQHELKHLETFSGEDVIGIKQ